MLTLTLHMDITRWSTLKSDWLYSLQLKMEKLYTVNKNKTRSWLWLRSWILITKFRLKLKKVGKTTRPFRYDLSQIPYNYTVEVTDRFKGLNLIDSAWRIMDGGSWHCTRDRDQDHSQEKEIQKGKREKERYIHLSAEFQRTARRDKKAFLSDQCKEIEENNRMGKTRDLFKKN